jgi:cellulose synthase/poly-beta-1,6-N-acetylglucosamine synthase-like glycosyltransferase
MYRSSVLKQVVKANTPYIVDDTFWTLETHRRKLGRIVYAPEACAWVQDPTNFRDWYRQNLRWLWGSFQGIRGHRIGTKATAMDAFYVLTLDWALYVIGAPVAIALIAPQLVSSWVVLAWYLGGYLAWVSGAAIATRRWHILILTPAIIATDWLYRIVFVHAFVKTIRQPVVETCRWESPQRYEPADAAEPVYAAEPAYAAA